MLNGVEEDVQISAGNEDTEHSLWGWSLHRVSVAHLLMLI